MVKALAICSALLLSGCEVGSGGIDFPRVSLFEPASTGGPPPSNARTEACRLARNGMGMPILVDPKLRSEAYAALGRDKGNELFRPVARTNNSFRCLCGTPEEKLKAKC